MAKLRWNLDTNNPKMWTMIITQKYKYRNPSHHANKYYIYRGIFKDKDIYTSNISHTIKMAITLNFGRINGLGIQLYRTF